MKKQIFHLLLATVITVIYSACGFLKESESEEAQAAGSTNTVNENLGGTQGSPQGPPPKPPHGGRFGSRLGSRFGMILG